VNAGAEVVRVKPLQIALRVSLTRRGLSGLGSAPPFPALLDTGNNHNFSIQSRHLLRWAGLDRGPLPTLGAVSERGKRIPLLGADLWIHPNRPGQLETWPGRPPFRLTLDGGIVVYPDDGLNYPRLPLLGLRAMTDNRLRLTVDGARRLVSLRTPRTWWFLG
jgi:hypothetical protein